MQIEASAKAKDVAVPSSKFQTFKKFFKSIHNKHQNLLDLVFAGYYKWGVFVENHPKLVIFMSLLVSLVISFGAKFLHFEYELNELYFSRSQPEYKDYKLMKDTWGGNRDAYFLFTRKDGENILNHETMYEIGEFHRRFTEDYEIVDKKTSKTFRIIVSEIRKWWIPRVLLRLFYLYGITIRIISLLTMQVFSGSSTTSILW